MLVGGCARCTTREESKWNRKEWIIICETRARFIVTEKGSKYRRLGARLGPLVYRHAQTGGVIRRESAETEIERPAWWGKLGSTASFALWPSFGPNNWNNYICRLGQSTRTHQTLDRPCDASGPCSKILQFPPKKMRGPGAGSRVRTCFVKWTIGTNVVRQQYLKIMLQNIL